MGFFVTFRILFLTGEDLMIEKIKTFLDTYPVRSSVFLGGLTSLAFAPLYLIPLAALGFSVFLYALRQESYRHHAFKYGWLFGFGHFVVGLYWLGNAIQTVGLWYFMPLGWFGLPAFLALFVAGVTWLTCQGRGQSPIVTALKFSLLWFVAEWLRGHILTGLPWNLAGYMWPLEILQICSVIGIYGLSFLTLLFLTSFSTQSRGYMLAWVSIFIVLFGWGQHRLTDHPTQLTGVNLRLVQASIPQNTKWLADHFRENFDKQLGLSAMEAERPLKAIIWSEASIPTFVTDYPILMETLAAVAPKDGYMIVGGPRHGLEGEIFTSTLVINDKAELVASYDKSHLVPFGEYFPFRKLFPFVSKLTPGTQDYSSGSGVRTLDLVGLGKFSPLVCYEAIFPGGVVGCDRPSWMLNQTNDAWYGNSSAPYQHLQIVRVRAIEEGIPLVRSANNGISAVIDAVGRIREQLDLNDIGFIDFDLPAPLVDQTFYSKWTNAKYQF